MTNRILDLGEFNNPVAAIPRLGKIHLGEPKDERGRTKGQAGYFVLPDELKPFFSEKPTVLPILLPSNERTYFFSQLWRRFAITRRQKNVMCCYGDGQTAKEVSRDFKTWTEIDCPGHECEYAGDKCKKTGFLWFYLNLPGQPLNGVWQIDTKGVNSMKKINAQVEAYKEQLSGNISMIPMLLSLIEDEDTDAEGKTHTIYVLNLTLDITTEQLAAIQRIPYREPSVSIPESSQEMPQTKTETMPEETPRKNNKAAQTPASDDKNKIDNLLAQCEKREIAFKQLFADTSEAQTLIDTARGLEYSNNNELAQVKGVKGLVAYHNVLLKMINNTRKEQLRRTSND